MNSPMNRRRNLTGKCNSLALLLFYPGNLNTFWGMNFRLKNLINTTSGMLSPVVMLSVLVLVFAAWGCGNSTQENATTDTPREEAVTEQIEENTESSDKNILFFGNSLTAGYGLEIDQAWPALIQHIIDSLDLDYQVINAGLSGETSSGGLNRIDWVSQQPIDIFMLELGANDALRGLDLKSTRDNLRGILTFVRDKYPDAHLIVAGMKAPPNMGPEYTQEFESIFPALAQEFEAALIPFLLEGVAGDPSLNLEDGIHPNVEGQKIVRDNVWQILRGVIEGS